MSTCKFNNSNKTIMFGMLPFEKCIWENIKTYKFPI